MKLLALLLLCSLVVGCGYGTHSMPPASASPTITQLSPNSMAHGSPQFTLTVEGMNFASAAVVNFNNAAMSTTFDNSGQLKATIPASAVSSTAMVPVTVTNPATGGIYGSPAVTSAAATFTIN